MSLRRAGSATLLLLRAYGTSGTLQQQGRALPAHALPALLQLSAHSGHFRSRQWWQEQGQQQQLPAVEGLWLRHLATAADRSSSSKQEAGEKPSAGSSSRAPSPAAAATPVAPARKQPLPGAQVRPAVVLSWASLRRALVAVAGSSNHAITVFLRVLRQHHTTGTAAP
jgi:hypothetical protein